MYHPSEFGQTPMGAAGELAPVPPPDITDCAHYQGCLAVRTLYDAAEHPLGDDLMRAFRKTGQHEPLDLPMRPDDLRYQAGMALAGCGILHACASACPLPR